MTRDLIDYLIAHIGWSAKTFGPGLRDKGVANHIRKELAEIEAETTPQGRAKEWTDVVLLGMDAMWRNYREMYPELDDSLIARHVVAQLVTKQQVNFERKWPDWRNFTAGQPIEHDRSHDPVEREKKGIDKLLERQLSDEGCERLAKAIGLEIKT